MSKVRQIHVILEMDAEGTKTEEVGNFYTTNLALDRIQALANTGLFYTVSMAYTDKTDSEGRLGYEYVESN